MATTLIESTGVIGSPLPNTYFDRIFIRNNSVELDISYFKQRQTRANENSNNIYFRIIQIQDREIYENIKNITNINLITSIQNYRKQEYQIKFLDIPASNFNTTLLPTLFSPYENSLSKNIKSITFNIDPQRSNFLGYIGLSYLYDNNLNTLRTINSSTSYSKKELEEVLYNGNVNTSRKNYYIVNRSTPWYGQIRKSQNIISTVETRPRTLDERTEVNTKIIYSNQQQTSARQSSEQQIPGRASSTVVTSEQVTSTEETRTASNTFQGLSGENTTRNASARSSTSQTSSRTSNFTTRQQQSRIDNSSQMPIGSNFSQGRNLTQINPPRDLRSNPFSLKTSEKVYKDFINQRPVFDPENIFSSNNILDNTVTINFTVDFDKLINDNFLDKNFITNNSQMMTFLKDSILEKSVTLVKKFIPNKNIFSSDINFKEPEQICTNIYTKILQPNTNNIYNFSITDVTKNADKYDYYVKILFENKINSLILKEINELRQDKKILQNYYSTFITHNKTLSSISLLEEKYRQLQESGIFERYIACYCRIYNISRTSTEYNNISTIFYLLDPKLANYNTNKVIEYINIHNELIKKYEDLYNLQKPPKLINSSVFKGSSVNLTENVSFNLLNAKTSLFEQKKKIKENNILIKKKNIEINYISSLNNNLISIEGFVDRIKQEKGRLFGTNTNISYSNEYMFTYLSPDIIRVINYDGSIMNEYALSNDNSTNIEDTLNNFMSLGNLSNINNGTMNIGAEIYKKDNYENEKLKTLTSKNYESYFSKKFGLTITVNSGDKKIIQDKIVNLNRVIEFNNLYNINIPNNILDLPNHLTKAREERSDLNTYLSVFNYRILMKIIFINPIGTEITLSNLTKSSLLNIINNSRVTQLRCRLVPYDYSYNTDLKYDISNIASFQNSGFTINIDRNISSQYIVELINSV